MTRRHWRNPHSTIEGYYGLGIMSGTHAGWDWFGHGGVFQGYISRTCVIPACELSITILTNAADGLAAFWLDGAMHILRAYAKGGAPKRRVRDWTGRWWGTFGAVDLVPVGNLVLAANPQLLNPFMDSSEIEVTGRDSGWISQAAGFQSFGQAVRRVRNKRGVVSDIWLGGGNLKRANGAGGGDRAPLRAAPAPPHQLGIRPKPNEFEDMSRQLIVVDWAGKPAAKSKSPRPKERVLASCQIPSSCSALSS